MKVFAGVDIGGTKIQSVVVDRRFRVVGQSFLLTPRSNGPAGVLDAVVVGIRSALAQAGAGPGDLGGIGLGSPGQVDSAAGTVSHAGNLPKWSGSVGVRAALLARFDVPIALRGDVQAAILGEARLGAGRPYQSMLGVFCGTGVGGGIVIGDALWKGRGAAGEIGHMVVKAGGAACPCGRRGCLEAYAGRAPMERVARRMAGQGKPTRLFEIMLQMGRTYLTGEVWAAALADSDPVASELIERNVRAMGIAIASAVNLMDVEAVIIGGGLTLGLGEGYVHRVRDAVFEHLVFPDRPPVVLMAALGNLAGAIGSAIAVKQAS